MKEVRIPRKLLVGDYVMKLLREAGFDLKRSFWIDDDSNVTEVIYTQDDKANATDTLSGVVG